MALDLYDEMRSWAVGVVTSLRSDEIPPEALQRADNAQMTYEGAGKAQYRKRFGMTLVNQTPLANVLGIGSPVVGQFQFPFRSGGSETVYQVRVTASGKVYIGVDAGTTNEVFTELTPSGFSATTALPDFALANNRGFLIDGEGARLGLKGTAIVDWGVGTVSGVVLGIGAAGNMTGDYDVLVLKYNTDIGQEGDWSAIASITGLTADQLQITVNAVPVGQTHFYYRVYLRKPSLGSGFFRVLAGTGFNATHQGFPLFSVSPTVSTTIDVSDVVLTEDYITAPPVILSHSLPPAGAKFAAFWQRRLFLATEDAIFWSQEDKPDAFHPLDTQPVNDNKGGKITGLKTEFDRLNIFTSEARAEVTGSDDPRTWILRFVDYEHGLDGHRSFVFYRGVAYWWNREHGPVAWDGASTPRHIGTELIRDKVAKGPANSSPVNASQLSTVASAALNDRVLFFVPDAGQLRLTRGLVWNTESRGWESSKWDPMDAASIATLQDGDGDEQIYLGNYNGQVFRLLSGGNDGVRTGTSQGTFVASATSVSIITDLTATFDTVGGGLRERKVTILNAAGEKVSEERPYIISNTATAITLSSSVADLTVGQTYTYLIGGPDFNFETYWGDFKKPFIEKRYDEAFLQFIPDDGVSQLRVNIAYDFDPLRNSGSASLNTTNTLWDIAEWDVGIWDDIAILTRKLWLGRTGLSHRVQLTNPYPDQGFTILKIAVLARQLTTRNVRTF